MAWQSGQEAYLGTPGGSARHCHYYIVEAGHRVRLGPQADAPSAEARILVVDHPLAVVTHTNAIAPHLDRRLVPDAARIRSDCPGDLPAVVVAHRVQANVVLERVRAREKVRAAVLRPEHQPARLILSA